MAELTDDQRAELRDEIAGTTIGGGYYQTAVATDEAGQIVDCIAPLIESWLADAWDQGPQHESDYLMTWGQFCPREIAQSANPYREDA